MTFYVKGLKNKGPHYACYTGMSLEIVNTLLKNLGCTRIQFITKDEYDKLANSPQAPVTKTKNKPVK